jgi:hypothetical protein
MKKYLLTILSLSLLPNLPAVQANPITSSEEILTLSKEDITLHFLPRQRPITKNLAGAILKTASTGFWGFIAMKAFFNEEKLTNSDIGAISTLTLCTLLMGWEALQDFRKIHADCTYNKNLKNNNFLPLEKEYISLIHLFSPSSLSTTKDLVSGTLKIALSLLVGGNVIAEIAKSKEIPTTLGIIFSLVGINVALLVHSGLKDFAQVSNSFNYRKTLKNNNPYLRSNNFTESF